ncbi:MAG: isopentenyl-diphosphate Delta-isomerase [Acidobacteriota bacterium]
MQRFFRIGNLIIVLLFLFISAFLITNVELPPWSHAISALSVLIFAAPAFWAAKMWLGWRDAATLFAVLGLFALFVETAAITTGLPYGHFGYSERLGYKLFDAVPWTVAFAWTPLILAAYSISAKIGNSVVGRVLTTTFVLLVFDLVIDAGAVYLGFWKYAGGGLFYGVPVSNFAGWLVSGLAGAIFMELMVSYLKPLLPVPVQLSSSAFFIIFFWTAVALFAGLTVPAVLGALVLVALAFFWRRYQFAFDDMIVFVDESGNAIGTTSKLEAHNSETRLHRAFSVFIFNRRGEVLLQQRSFGKKTWPGVWSNSCCGHVMLHESTERAAARRLKYELGLTGVSPVVALPDFRYRAEKDGVVENEICPVLIGFTDEEPQLNPTEVATIRWIDWYEFLASVDRPDTEISPWAVKEVRLLADSDVFQKWFRTRVPVSETHAAVR